MQRSEQIDQLAGALAAAQAKIKAPIKDKTATVPMKAGGQYSYKYADLASVIDALREPFSENGLAITNRIVCIEKTDVLECMLMHKSGQWMASSYPVPVFQRPQDLGGFLTYLKRYLVSGLAGTSSEEDDDCSHGQGDIPGRKQAPPAGRQGSPGPAPGPKGGPKPKEGPKPNPGPSQAPVADPTAMATAESAAELNAVCKANNWKSAELMAYVAARFGAEKISQLRMGDIAELKFVVTCGSYDVAKAKLDQQNAKPGDFGYMAPTGVQS